MSSTLSSSSLTQGDKRKERSWCQAAKTNLCRPDRQMAVKQLSVYGCNPPALAATSLQYQLRAKHKPSMLRGQYRALHWSTTCQVSSALAPRRQGLKGTQQVVMSCLMR